MPVLCCKRRTGRSSLFCWLAAAKLSQYLSAAVPKVSTSSSGSSYGPVYTSSFATKTPAASVTLLVPATLTMGKGVSVKRHHTSRTGYVAISFSVALLIVPGKDSAKTLVVCLAQV